MGKYISTTIAIAVILGLSACSTNNQNAQNSTAQTIQQRRACTQGDRHPWCMQMAQTRPLGAAPYGLENNQPTNPEMQEDETPYPTNPALNYRGPNASSFPGLGGFSGVHIR